MNQLFADPVFVARAAAALGCLAAGLLLALAVFPLWARRRCRRTGRPVPAWLSAQAVFFWPPIKALIALVLLLAAMIALPKGVQRSFDAAIGESPIGQWLVLAGIWLFTCLATWALMARSARVRVSLAYRSVWLPAIVMATMAMVAGAGSVASLNRIRGLAKRCIDATRLRELHISLLMYHEDHKAYPPSLRTLVDAGQLSPYSLISPRSDHDLNPFAGVIPYTGPCDVGYVPGAMDHEDLIALWFDPKFNHGEIAFVAYGDGRVRELKPDQFAAELARTRQWLKDHPPPPATQPATCPRQ